MSTDSSNSHEHEVAKNRICNLTCHNKLFCTLKTYNIALCNIPKKYYLRNIFPGPFIIVHDQSCRMYIFKIHNMAKGKM